MFFLLKDMSISRHGYLIVTEKDYGTVIHSTFAEEVEEARTFSSSADRVSSRDVRSAGRVWE
jgi:hypothetical protein